MKKNVMLKSTVIDFELVNGEKVQLTLNFSQLLNVRNKRKVDYEKYNKVIMEGAKDIFDNVQVVYMAYLCGLDDVDEAMSESEFIALIPPYMNVINETVSDLIAPKKKTDSEKPSESEAAEGQNVE